MEEEIGQRLFEGQFDLQEALALCCCVVNTVSDLKRKFRPAWPHLDERTRRIMAATEAMSLGYGGVTLVSLACGLSRKAIRKGIVELERRGKPLLGRVRRAGGGRKSITQSDPGLVQTLEALIDEQTRGDPESILRDHLSTLGASRKKSTEKYVETSRMPTKRNGGWLSNLQRNPFLYAGISCLILSASGCGSSVMPVPSSTPSPSQASPAPQQMGSVTISPQQGVLTAGQTMRFTAVATGGGTIVWSVNGIVGGSTTVGTVDAAGTYMAPPISHSINVVVQAALSSAPQTNFATATVALIQPGQVRATANPQVASYSMNLPQPGTVAIQFGTDTSYGMRTWAQPTPSIPANYGGEVNIQVAGMRGSTNYHLQALVTLASGVTYKDSDHTFATGIPPLTAALQITTPSGLPPQPGIQLFDTVQFGATPYNPKLAQAFATDLQGNVIWTYSYAGSPVNVITPIKPLPNGHFLLVLTVTSGPTNSTIPAGTANDVREIDLVGNTIHDLPMATLNQALTANGFAGLNLFAFSRDVLALPNGHYVFLAQMAKAVSNVTGYPGTTNIAGDVLVDVDQNYKPDWVWNSFDHLDINRHPFQFPPDWTHSDALLYSTDDHDLMLSIRNQNWIIKIDYQDATGTGNIVWRLGQGGDFKLIGGVDPTDWFYAQHGINFFSPNTSGMFQLGLIDDGDDRQFPQGVTCGTAGAPVCNYSTVPVLLVDEAAMTASLMHHYIAPADLYSFFGGQADLLPNGDIEVNFCSAKSGATVQEYQPGAVVVETSPQIVWQAVSPGYDQYRALRLPSLYPGVQW